ncbi:MAG: restriction endonuclease subunit S, partial [Gemmatimonadales bacterium]
MTPIGEFSQLVEPEWKGSLPPMWHAERLRFTVALNPSKLEIRELGRDTEVSFVPMESVGEYGGLELDESKPIADVSEGYTYFRDGDVVVAKITPCFENGKGALAKGLLNGAAFGTTELHVLRPCAGMDATYLFYLTLGEPFRRLGAATMYGAGGQKRVPEAFVRDLVHPVPELRVQRAIAAFLDRKTAEIDALVVKKELLIELLEEKRTALITQAVTKGLDSGVPMKESGVEWIGRVPAHWDLAKMWRISRAVSGGTPSKEDPRYWNGDIPWVSPKDMKRRTIDSSIDTITDVALYESGLRLVQPPTLLIVVRGMILAHSFPVAITAADVTINQDMKAVQFDDSVSPDFGAWFFGGVGKQVLASVVEESAHGTR